MVPNWKLPHRPAKRPLEGRIESEQTVSSAEACCELYFVGEAKFDECGVEGQESQLGAGAAGTRVAVNLLTMCRPSCVQRFDGVQRLRVRGGLDQSPVVGRDADLRFVTVRATP